MTCPATGNRFGVELGSTLRDCAISGLPILTEERVDERSGLVMCALTCSVKVFDLWDLIRFACVSKKFSLLH
jgi:hypothetical protein